jgi:hypothetical protein
MCVERSLEGVATLIKVWRGSELNLGTGYLVPGLNDNVSKPDFYSWEYFLMSAGAAVSFFIFRDFSSGQ